MDGVKAGRLITGLTNAMTSSGTVIRSDEATSTTIHNRGVPVTRHKIPCH